MEFRGFVAWEGVFHPDGDIDPYLEASGISRDDPTRTWLGRSKGSGFRLAGNVLSSREKLARLLGIDPVGINDLLSRSMDSPAPYSIEDVPRNYNAVDLDSIPIPTYYKGDGGPYITSGILHSKYGGSGNLSFHRMMYLGDGRFAVRVVPRHLKALLEESEGDGERLGATVSIGADPASLLAASCSMEFGSDELEISSSIHREITGEPLRTFSVDGGPTLSPLGSEIVLLGHFTGGREREGPFVDVTSTMDRSGMDPGEPVFRVDRALAREDPILHVLVPGGLEHYLLMGLPREPAIIRSVRSVVPGVKGVRLTEGGCCWLHGVISIEKVSQEDGRKAIMAAFTGHPSMKSVVVVDSDIDIMDDREIEWALATRFQADRDLVVLDGVFGSSLDPSKNEDGTTSKWGMDATRPLSGGERFVRIVE